MEGLSKKEKSSRTWTTVWAWQGWRRVGGGGREYGETESNGKNTLKINY